MKMTNLVLVFFLFHVSGIKCQTLEIEHQEGIIEFGTRLQNSDNFHKIKVKNIGTRPLIIKKAGTDDGGSMATWSNAPILPNDTAFIEFRYDTQRIGFF